VGPKLTDFIRCGLLAHFHGDGDFISVHEKYVAVEGDATNFSDFANTYAGNRAGYVELFVIDNTEETKSKAYRRHVNQVQWVYGCESGLTKEESHTRRKLWKDWQDDGALPYMIPMLLGNACAWTLM